MQAHADWQASAAPQKVCYNFRLRAQNMLLIIFTAPHTHTHTNRLAHTRAFINYVWASLYALLLRHSGARAARGGGGCVAGGVLGRASRRRIKNQFANFARTY